MALLHLDLLEQTKVITKRFPSLSLAAIWLNRQVRSLPIAAVSICVWAAKAAFANSFS